jgi:VIT1/CCC1 family predicted Fe2+/Mn2+ transporter
VKAWSEEKGKMSSENKSLSDEARSCIRQHLSAIERALAEAGASLDERRAVTADVESQILEMLGVPAGAEPTLRNVEQILIFGGSATAKRSPSSAPGRVPRAPQKRPIRVASTS